MNLYHKAIAHYGVAHQILKAAEEHSEYAAALTKYGLALLRGETPVNGKRVDEERADCEIMDRQLDIIFADRNGGKTQEKLRKLDRLSMQITQERRMVSCDETIGGDGD
ncbi:MAG: hypothetical protein HGA87_05315 [Desulfobulbaceae bacterium]|nr:hypothetical protein [Desulfobulbaceae bacterium]